MPRRAADRKAARRYYRHAGQPLRGRWPLWPSRAAAVSPERESKPAEDLAAPQLVERRGARPGPWWERALAWLWRVLDRPPRRLYAPSWARAMVMLLEQYQVQRWRPLEVYRVRKLP